MSLGERVEQITASFWAWVVAAVGGFIVWLVRQVFTNQAQIELLKQEIQHRDALRTADREAVQEVRESVREVKDSVQRIEDVLISERRD